MATVNWSSKLPKCPKTWEEESIDALIRSTMDVGSGKTRLRFTRELIKGSMTLTLPKSSWDDWKTFWHTDLVRGTNSFNYLHPYTGVTLKLKFSETPKVAATARAFTLSMSFEEVV